MAYMNKQTATLANVTSSATSVTLFEANAGAVGRTIFNDSTSALDVKFDAAAASSSSFTVELAAGEYYEFPLPLYGGKVTGIWDAANGAARTTEY